VWDLDSGSELHTLEGYGGGATAYSVTIGQGLGKGSIPFIWVMALTILLVITLAHIALVCSSNGWLRLGILPTVPYLSASSSSVREIQLFFLFAATCQILLWEWIAVTTTFALYTPGLVQKFQLADFYQQTLLSVHLGLLAASIWLCVRLLFKIAAVRGAKSSRAIPASTFVSLLYVVSLLS